MATYNTAFGTLSGTQDATGANTNAPSNQAQANGGQNGGTPGLPGTQTLTQSPQQTQSQQAFGQQPRTFAQLQQQGIARPAPTQMATGSTPAGGFQYQTFGGSQQAQDLRAQLQAQLEQMQTAPSRFDDPRYQQAYQAKRDNLTAEFGGQAQSLDEEMARRGILDSSIAGGRLGDLRGQQARALATLEGEMLQEQLKAEQEDKRLMLDQMQALLSTAGEQDLGTFSANIESMKASGQLDIMAKQLMLDAETQGRSLDLQQARDQVAAELGRGELQYKYSALEQEKALENQRLEETRALRLQNLGISNRELDLRAEQIQQEERLRGRELNLQEARDKAEVDYRAQQMMREDRSLSLQEARDKAQNEIDRDRNTITRESEANRQQDAALDRALREQLGMGQLEIDRLRATQEGRQFLVQLAQVIGIDKLTAEQLAALGLGGGATGGGTPATSTGGVGGVSGSPATDTFY